MTPRGVTSTIGLAFVPLFKREVRCRAAEAKGSLQTVVGSQSPSWELGPRPHGHNE